MKSLGSFALSAALLCLLNLSIVRAAHAADDSDSLERDADLAAKKLESKCDDLKVQRRDEFLNKVVRPLTAKFDARIERNRPFSEEITWRFKHYRVSISQPSDSSTGEVRYSYVIREVSGAEKSFQEVVSASVTEPCRSFQTGLDPNAAYALSSSRNSDEMQDDLNRASQVIADFNAQSTPAAGASPSPRRRKQQATQPATPASKDDR